MNKLNDVDKVKIFDAILEIERIRKNMVDNMVNEITESLEKDLNND